MLPGPARLFARNLATLLVGFLDTPNGGPGVEADQLAALDNNAPVANPKQYPVGVGRRAVCVAHPDALSNPGLGYPLLRHRLRHRPPCVAASYDYSIAKRSPCSTSAGRSSSLMLRLAYGTAM